MDGQYWDYWMNMRHNGKMTGGSERSQGVGTGGYSDRTPFHTSWEMYWKEAE